MAERVTDPEVLKQLNAAPSSPQKVTDPDILAQLDAQPSSVMDSLKSIGTGIVEGARGFIPGLQHNAESLKNVYREGLGLPTQPVPPGAAEVNAATDQQFGLHQPQTPAGEYFRRGGQFIGNPASYIGGPANMLGKMGVAGLAGIGSKAGEDVGARFDHPNLGSFLGAVLGGAAPSMARTAITPFPAGPQRMRDVAAVQAEGVPLTAGDRTGNTMLKAAESELSTGTNEAQKHAFTQAVFNRVGEQIGDRPITGQHGVVDTMLRRTGAQFDNLQARNRADMDHGLIADLRQVHDTYNGVPGLYPQDTVNTVNGSINRVLDAMQNAGSLSGREYQTLRSNLSRAARGASDPQRAEALHDITNALDDAMERTIQRTNPNDAGAWAQARRDYTNALVLERWAGSQNMSPATLSQAAKAVYGKRQYVRGADDFSELAEPGRRVLAQYQDSGTPRRLQIENIMKGLGGIAGFGVGASHGGTAGAAEGGVAGLLLGELAGPMIARPAARAALMNPVTQSYLGNQLLPHGYTDTIPARLARALAQTQGAQ